MARQRTVNLTVLAATFVALSMGACDDRTSPPASGSPPVAGGQDGGNPDVPSADAADGALPRDAGLAADAARTDACGYGGCMGDAATPEAGSEDAGGDAAIASDADAGGGGGLPGDDAGPDAGRDSGQPGGVCRPGERIACSLDQGECRSGRSTCLDDGSGWGPCEGGVLPSPETCGDGLDNDCDGQTDEHCPDCTDRDGDGYGAGRDCLGPDCDDADPEVHSGAAEVCDDGKDNDCLGGDEACCLDGDGDLHGVGPRCQGPDCDDADPEVHSGAAEVCDDGKDNDCDGQVDPDALCLDCVDADSDGYGVGPDCAGPDCDDADPAVNPGHAERCDGKDNDCDDRIDEGFALGAPCSAGVGACRAEGVTVCGPDGLATVCNAVPGRPRPEVCDNGVDEDCDGRVDDCGCLDRDGDNYGQGDGCLGPDCNDANAGIHPGADEVCLDGLDNDCDAATPDNAGACNICQDPDGDGYGVGPACRGRDCNENDQAIHDGAQELCDGRDNDCDGQTDEGFRVGQACRVGQGVCVRDGRLRCKADGSDSECDVQPAPPPGDEVCNNRQDDDCDGQTDENPPCNVQDCLDLDGDGFGVGAGCQGTQDCDDRDRAVFPQPREQSCGDRKDNDCDGQIDLQDPDCGGANTTCQDTMMCILNQCRPPNNNDACYQNCLGRACEAARPLAQALLDCNTRNNCNLDQNCLQNRCQQELMTCVNNGGCGDPNARNCDDYNVCMDSCQFGNFFQCQMQCAAEMSNWCKDCYRQADRNCFNRICAQSFGPFDQCVSQRCNGDLFNTQCIFQSCQNAAQTFFNGCNQTVQQVEQSCANEFRGCDP